MRFDPQKALEAAEMIPPGRDPGGENQGEAGRIVTELLVKQGWHVEEQKIELADKAGLRGLIIMSLLCFTPGLLLVTGKLSLEWVGLLMVFINILDCIGLRARFNQKRVNSTLLTASLEKEEKSLPCMHIAVSMQSQQLTNHSDKQWMDLKSGMIKYLAVPILLLLVSKLFYKNSTLSQLFDYLFLMSCLLSLATMEFRAFHFNKKTKALRSGKIWPENREAIGFAVELARAWAARPSNKVALRLYFAPTMHQKSVLASLDGPLIWINQPGSEPGLVISNDGTNDFLERVCQDLHIPFEKVSGAVFHQKETFVISGRVAPGATEVNPQCMLLMSQVVHQAALRWAKPAGNA